MMTSFDDFLFWQEMYNEAGLPVPRVLATMRKERVMLLEDWGDRDGVDHMADEGDPARRRLFLMDLLHCVPVIQSLTDGRRERRSAPVDIEKELVFTREHAGDTLFAGQDMDWMDDFFRRIIEQLNTTTWQLAHRDFHFRNVLVKGDAFCLIDFQDTRMAPPGYDLASMLFDNYLDLGRLRGIVGVDVQAPPFRWTALQRSLKALGTFCYFGLKMNKEWFVPSIRPALGHIGDHLEALGLERESVAWGKLVQGVRLPIPEDD